MYNLKQIPSEAQIKKYLRRIVFGKNIHCPTCWSRQVLAFEQRYRCRRCRTKFSLLSHTWLAGMHLSHQSFWLVLWCWTSQVPILQAQALTRRSEKAVRHWYGLFREHLPESEAVLSRLVQLDEAYFKGRAVLMGKQVGTRKLACEVLNRSTVQRHHALSFAAQHVRPRSRVNTDGAAIYRQLDQWWPIQHSHDNHSKFEFSQTSEIEGVFGNLRTFIRRMYHHVTPAELPNYVREFCYRFSSPETFDNPLNYLEKSLFLVPSR